MDVMLMGLSLVLFGLAIGLAMASHKLEGGRK